MLLSPTMTTTVVDSSGEVTLRSRRSSPTDNTNGQPHAAAGSPQGQMQMPRQQQPQMPKVPVVIPPPTLRPQHVYAPVAPLGMLTLGVFSKKKKDEVGPDGEKIMHGITF